MEKFCQAEKNQRKKFVFPDRREGEGMFYPSDSEVKTLPLSEERVKHSSEGCFSGSPKIFQVTGYIFSVRSLTYQNLSLGVKSLVNIMNFEII